MYLDQGKKLEASDRSGANHVGRSGLQARANEEQKGDGTNKFLERFFIPSNHIGFSHQITTQSLRLEFLFVLTGTTLYHPGMGIIIDDRQSTEPKKT